MDTYGTISDMREKSQKTGYLLRTFMWVLGKSREWDMIPCGQCTDDANN